MFYSVLYPTEESALLPRRKEAPESFRDLHLDLILKRVLQEAAGTGLEEYFYTPVSDPEVIRYRQEIMKELEDGNVRGAVLEIVTRFAFLGGTMAALKEQIEGARAGGSKTENWLAMGRLLEKCVEFTTAMTGFCGQVRDRQFRAEGLRRFAEYVGTYCESESFRALAAEAGRLRGALDEIRYCLWFKTSGSTVKLLPGGDQEDWAAGIAELFARFRQGEPRDFRKRLDDAPVSEHLENEILRLLSRQTPAVFRDLRDFCGRFACFDEVVLRFASEARFYFVWLDMMAPLRAEGLPFCYPEVREQAEDVFDGDCFDLSLALQNPKGIVTNGFSFRAPERILVVSGPNQGGKSTFARAFGQTHFLASLGLPVPGSAARLPLCDAVLTHFEREERIEDRNGKLRDDLLRLKRMFDAATPRTVFVINEIFASTTAWDALILGRHMLETLTEKGGPAVVVTFLEELAEFGPQTVSMTSEVPDPGRRVSSYRIQRKKPDGLNYAMQLAQRHALSYEEVRRRVGR